MGKQPVQGQKKSKDAIAKAASQKKAGAKVYLPLSRNGPREKSKKKLITPYSLIKPLMTDLSQVSPNLENTSPPQVLSKNTKSWAQSPEPSLENVSKTDQSEQLKPTADKPCSLPYRLLKRLPLLLPKPNRSPRKESLKRNDAICHLNIDSLHPRNTLSINCTHQYMYKPNLQYIIYNGRKINLIIIESNHLKAFALISSICKFMNYWRITGSSCMISIRDIVNSSIEKKGPSYNRLASF